MYTTGEGGVWERVSVSSRLLYVSLDQERCKTGEWWVRMMGEGGGGVTKQIAICQLGPRDVYYRAVGGGLGEGGLF
jgi:hypothetical protein